MNCHELGRKYELHQSSVNQFLRRNGIEIRKNKIVKRKFTLNESYFKNIDTQEKAYWLGFIYADGYLVEHSSGSKYFGLDVNDQDYIHLVKLKIALDATYNIKSYPDKGKTKSRLLVCSDKIVNDLGRHGATFRKTFTLSPPNLKKSLCRSFFRGYFDGDGCISHNSSSVHSVERINVTGTTEMLDFFRDLMKEAGIETTGNYSQRRKESEIYTLEMGGAIKAYNFLDYLYKNSTIHLDRKYNLYLIAKSEYLSRPSK